MKCIDENGNVTWSEGYINALTDAFNKIDRVSDSNGVGFLVPECMQKTIMRKIEECVYRNRSLADRCMCAAMRTTGEMKSIWLGHEQALRKRSGL